MEVTGKIVLDLGEISGVSKAGNNWKKHEYVLETQESYPRKIHFSFFGDKADQYLLQAGQNVRLSFDIDSHEYNGRWFTSINGWKAEPATEPQMQPAAPVQNFNNPDNMVQQVPNNIPPASSPDDLPF